MLNKLKSTHNLSVSCKYIFMQSKYDNFTKLLKSYFKKTFTHCAHNVIVTRYHLITLDNPVGPSVAPE